ncbi:unnamed protein product [Lepeophtheirus salmonis]|uniref:(salmon louse) hypothetical protein n=1 Tax=Lepeophtheirus salmonis TaxID=72036 RepID=A0A7R8HE19_LEPSM|nr:unnamed protein product [Lepeophtheirus salmonis]CAF3021747.1 unnamed protein product [Lepeophtheirus salmonis]
MEWKVSMFHIAYLEDQAFKLHINSGVALISENNHENPSFTSSQTPPVVSSHSSPFHPSHSVEKKYSPFNPRFAVERNEISDEEWESELLQSFHESGIVPNVLQSAPKFLINVNFGNYECVHMGTELRAEDSAYPPTSLTFPVSSKHNNNQTLHTLVMLDLDNHNWLHWMLVNIPGTNYKKGTDITDYIGPTPTDRNVWSGNEVPGLDNKVPKEETQKSKRGIQSMTLLEGAGVAAT